MGRHKKTRAEKEIEHLAAFPAYIVEKIAEIFWELHRIILAQF